MRSWACALLLVLLFPSGVVGDIFEQGHSADAALRKALEDDRGAFYLSTPGLGLKPTQERVSSARSLAADGAARPRGLRDMDKALDLFLLEQLRKDRAYKGLVAPSHPLLLLEYASPVTADIVKHYRVSAYERLAIEQARLADIERASEGRGERLGRLSQRECLKANEARGLVEAMRLCQKASRPFDALLDMDEGASLSDGRRSIHVLAQALRRLGLEKARLARVVAMSGERIISANAQEERLPETTFTGKAAHERDMALGRWRQALEAVRSSGQLGVEKLQELSLPGIAVTRAHLEDILLLTPSMQESLALRLASTQGFFEAQRAFQDASGLLSICAVDPALPEEFRRIVLEKKTFLEKAVQGKDKEHDLLGEYKDILAVAARAADVQRLAPRARADGGVPVTAMGLMVNF